jgi:hypothetical protein
MTVFEAAAGKRAVATFDEIHLTLLNGGGLVQCNIR